MHRINALFFYADGVFGAMMKVRFHNLEFVFSFLL